MRILSTYGARPSLASRFGVAARLSLPVALSALIAMAALSFVCHTPLAFAETDNIDDVPSELQQRVEETSAAFNEATVKVKELEQRIDENTARIAELEEKIPVQREKSAAAMRVTYKLNHDGYSLVNAVLESGSFMEFLERLSYMDYIQNKGIQDMLMLSAMQDELKTAQAELEQEREEALEEQQAAKDALDEAMAIRQQAIEAAAAAAAQEAAEQAAREAEVQGKLEAQPEGEASGSVTASAPAVDPVNSGNTDRDAFIAEWAPRIDAYFEGSPLYGQGENFAKSAWKYCIDPRWSAAISNTESSKARVCIRPHNAWGWGAADSDPYNLAAEWDTWEEAIDAHARGLAKGYGYTISINGAKRYCPYTWQSWYNRTLTEMAKI